MRPARSSPHPTHQKARLPALLLALSATLVACERPDHIEIDPRMPRLTRKGETVRLHAKMMDRNGRVFPTERATWSSRDPFVAAVSNNGEVAALSSGHTVLTAKWNELSATVPVEIDLVEAVSFDPATVELKADGDAVKLKVVALDAQGHAQKDREIHLQSLSPEVARVDSEGKVWGLKAGTARVQAKIDDKIADATIVVK